MRPLISSQDYDSPYRKELYQIITKNPINEQLKKQFFQIQIPFAWLITNFSSLKHYYVRQIFQKICIF
jgi:hypothetical protein